MSCQGRYTPLDRPGRSGLIFQVQFREQINRREREQETIGSICLFSTEPAETLSENEIHHSRSPWPRGCLWEDAKEGEDLYCQHHLCQKAIRIAGAVCTKFYCCLLLLYLFTYLVAVVAFWLQTCKHELRES